MITYNKGDVIGLNGVQYKKHEYIDQLLRNYIDNYNQLTEAKNDYVKNESEKAMDMVKTRLYEIIDTI